MGGMKTGTATSVSGRCHDGAMDGEVRARARARGREKVGMDGPGT